MNSKLKLITYFVSVTSSCFAANAGLFGQEVGVAKCHDSMKVLSSSVKFELSGVSKYSNGNMYEGNAANLGLSGAKTILFVCEKDDTLSAIQLVINKDYFNDYQKMLKAKYKQVKLINPSVGDKLARYTQGNSAVLLIAPHLSFDMKLSYATNKFWKDMETTNNQEQQSSQKYQQNAL